MAIGLFLGVIFIMFNQMLIMFGIFVERSQVPGQPLPRVQSQQAMAVFAWFLLTVYFLFGSLLYVFRNDIIVDGESFEVLFIVICHSLSVVSCRQIYSKLKSRTSLRKCAISVYDKYQIDRDVIFCGL